MENSKHKNETKFPHGFFQVHLPHYWITLLSGANLKQTASKIISITQNILIPKKKEQLLQNF